VLKVPGLKHRLCTGFFKNSLHPAVNENLTLFRAGESDGGEKEGWRPTSVTPLPVQVGSLATTSPQAILGYGSNFYLTQGARGYLLLCRAV